MFNLISNFLNKHIQLLNSNSWTRHMAKMNLEWGQRFAPKKTLFFHQNFHRTGKTFLNDETKIFSTIYIHVSEDPTLFSFGVLTNEKSISWVFSFNIIALRTCSARPLWFSSPIIAKFSAKSWQNLKTMNK